MAEGITGSAGVVTSAAAVMVGVFAVFATLSTLDMKQLGVGLAAAILIDATIIRAVVLPSADDPARRRQLVGPALPAPPQPARRHPTGRTDAGAGRGALTAVGPAAGDRPPGWCSAVAGGAGDPDRTARSGSPRCAGAGPATVGQGARQASRMRFLRIEAKP